MNRLVGMRGDEIFRLYCHRRTGLLRPLDGGIAVVGTQGEMEKRPFRQDSRSTCKHLQIVAIARIQQNDPAILLALGSAILAPAIRSAKAQSLAIELQRRIE